MYTSFFFFSLLVYSDWLGNQPPLAPCSLPVALLCDLCGELLRLQAFGHPSGLWALVAAAPPASTLGSEWAIVQTGIFFLKGLKLRLGLQQFSLSLRFPFADCLLCKPDILLKSYLNGYAGCLKSQGTINYSIVLLYIRKTAQHKFSATFHATPLFFFFSFPHWIMVCHLPAPDSTKGGVGSPHTPFPAHKGLNWSPWAHLTKQKSVLQVTQRDVFQ